MMKKLLLFVPFSVCWFLVSFPLYTQAAESREQLLESALLNRYHPVLVKVVQSQFYCETVTSIKRLGTEREYRPHYEVTVQLETFQGAHNPPHDLVTVTLRDTLFGVEVLKVDRKQNLSPEESRKYCEHEIARRREYFKKLQP